MSPPPSVELSDLLKVIAAFEASNWNEVHLVSGETEIHLAIGAGQLSARPTPVRPVAPAVDTPATATEPLPPPVELPPTELAPGTITVHAPSVGVFWRSPKPGAPPFVEVGDDVAADQALCIIEVMKLMTNLTPGTSGRITSILVPNGAQIERGQALLTLLP